MSIQKLMIIDEKGKRYEGFFSESAEEVSQADQQKAFREKLYLYSMMVGIVASGIAIVLGVINLKKHGVINGK